MLLQEREEGFVQEQIFPVWLLADLKTEGFLGMVRDKLGCYEYRSLQPVFVASHNL